MIGHKFTPAEMSQIIHSATMRGEQAGGIEVVFKALQAGKIAAAWASRGDASISIATLKRMGLPVLVIVGDDDYVSTGPKAFKFIKPLIRWTRGVIVHGAGAEAMHYATAVEGTLALGRLVMIETSSAFIGPWIIEAGAKLKQVIAPQNGPHPAIPERGNMH